MVFFNEEESGYNSIESFDFHGQDDFDKKEIYTKSCSGTMFRFPYCGKYGDLNEIDYESDKTILEILLKIE